MLLPLLTVLALLGASAPAHALDAAGLQRTLARELRLAGTFSGAYVRNLDTGTALFAVKENVARPPASVQKLYTTATTLLRFGPDTSFRTQVLGGGALDAQGVWRGDLYLRGGGDPTLSNVAIGALADAIAGTGITRVSGSILGDESLFDASRGSARTGFGFDRDIGGLLSALAVGRGFARDGSPAKEAARRLAKALRADGVAVDGRTEAAPAPPGAPELVAIQSPPVRELIRLTNVPSDNFIAEMLLKDLGASFGGAGTTIAGSGVVRSELLSFGIHPRIADGSGLSRANLTTPRQVVRLLERMHNQETAGTFEASLPVAGRTGTLRRRMRGTAAQDRCRAKTGTIFAVSTLAGVCRSASGQAVGFAFMMSRTRVVRARRAQDRMTAAIARYDGF